MPRIRGRKRQVSDTDTMVVKQKFPPRNRNRPTNDDCESRLNEGHDSEEDAELIVLDSLDSDDNSGVEEIPLGKDSPVMVCLSESSCSPNNREKELKETELLGLNDHATEESRLRCEVERLLDEVNRLKKENVKLQEQLQKLRSAGDNEALEGTIALVTVTFRCGDMAKKYKHKVKKSFKKILSKEPKGEILVKSVKDDMSDYKDLFVVDTSADRRYTPSKEGWNAPPLYYQTFEQPMQKTPEVTPSVVKLKSTVCFNCQGDHTLTKCPEVWDHDRIAENKKIHFSTFVKSARYHVDKETCGKYKPGELSEELRSALGLKPDEVPKYIYRMRILGYPPGWLMEAKIESSGLVLYDSEGKAVVDENVEDGEVETSSIRVQYDPKKLVSFPGFNVPLPPGVVDLSARLGFPEMKRSQLRSEVEKSMKPPEAKAYRKRKLSPVGNRKKMAKLDPSRIEYDMDIDSTDDGAILNESDDEARKCVFVPPLPRELSNPVKPPPPPLPYHSPLSSPRVTALRKTVAQSPSDTDDNLSQESSRSLGTGKVPHPRSPSLTDLEAAKIRLMEELGKVSEPGTPSGSSQSPAIIQLKKLSIPNSPSANALSNSEDADIDRSTSLSVTPGTPSLLKHSPFSILPDSSSFSEGITEHLCFENLPDSTGQYEKMRKVLGKVRESQKEQQ